MLQFSSAPGEPSGEQGAGREQSVTTPLCQGRFPGQVLQRCSLCSALLCPGSPLLALLCSAQGRLCSVAAAKEDLHPKLIQRCLLEDSWTSQAEHTQGLYRGSWGWGSFSRVGIGPISVLSSDWLELCSGIGYFLHRIRVRFGSGFRAKVCFFLWSFLAFWLQF